MAEGQKKPVDGVRRQAPKDEERYFDTLANKINEPEIPTPSGNTDTLARVDDGNGGDDSNQTDPKQPTKSNFQRYQERMLDRTGQKPPKDLPGGPAVNATTKPPPSKPETPIEKPEETPRAARPLGQGANAVGKIGANTIKSLKNLTTAFRGAITGALKTFGTIFINPATAPWAWGITLALLLIVLITVPAVALLGASAQTPNSAGKSLPEYQPSYEVKKILSDIISISNSADLEKAMIEKKETLLLAINQAKSELQAKYADNPNTVKSITLLDDLSGILQSASTADPKGNQKLAESFKTKVRALFELWTTPGVTLKGTALPIVLSSPRFNTDEHGSIAISPGGDSDHNSYFGQRQLKSGKQITADALDIYAPLGTQVFAPFSGKYEFRPPGAMNHDSIELNGQDANGVPMSAVLAHCHPEKNTGDISAGAPLCKLCSDVSVPHLHFELKVNGIDIARTNKSQKPADLWKKMTDILGGK